MDFVAMGQKIRKRRLELNYTQEHLAELTGLTPNYIGAIERATSKCSLETLTVIAKVLNLDTDFLLFDIKDQNINYFMEQALERNDIDNIVVICNKDYADKANNREGGVGYEAGIIISEIKSSPLQRRVIPVAVEFDGDGKPYLPTKFKELYYIDLTKETGYDELLSAIRSFKTEKC